MDGGNFLHRKDREALLERWLLRAGRAFERMFAESSQDQLVTFTQREDLACVLGKELAAFLLEEHVAADNQVRPAEKRPPYCPKCQQPGQRVTKSNGKLWERELTTRAGEIKLQREEWRCKQCRILFFSIRPQTEVGDGALQPADFGEGGTTSKQGSILQRSQ